MDATADRIASVVLARVTDGWLLVDQCRSDGNAVDLVFQAAARPRSSSLAR